MIKNSYFYKAKSGHSNIYNGGEPMVGQAKKSSGNSGTSRAGNSGSSKSGAGKSTDINSNVRGPWKSTSHKKNTRPPPSTPPPRTTPSPHQDPVDPVIPENVGDNPFLAFARNNNEYLR